MEQAESILKQTSQPLLVVGVAASAGGLEALSLFLRKLPIHANLCVVIAQHLSPDHESMLAKLLSRESLLKVETAADGMMLGAGKAYVIPPAVNAVVHDMKICLTAADQFGVPKPSANELFVSLADQFAERACAVVLSGTGSDGARGCREIKAHGGFTFAQSPSQAKYDGMPLAAIDTACIDRVLPAEEIGKELVRLAEFKDLSADRFKKPIHKDSLSRILQLVFEETGVDFSNYKDNTLHRRIDRRLIATDTSSWMEYEKYLSENLEEVQKLYQDLLISVTAFFRDASAFTELELALRQIIQRKSKGDEIRVWVAGCATGEEAYSIAMILYDLLDGQIFDYRLQVFATDIDLKALAIARKGRYDATSLKGLKPNLIKRHFNAVNDGFQISKHLREFVVFAKQNLVGDPAFLRLDLVSCRNVLIYMKAELQKQIQATFHYGLNPGGFLFLGRSESLPGSELFESKIADCRLFVRKEGNNHDIYRRYKLINRSISTKTATAPKSISVLDNVDDKIIRAVARYVTQKAFVIDEVMDIRFIYGDLTEITQLRKGRTSLNLQDIIHPHLQLEIKGLIFKAKKEGIAQHSRAISHQSHYLYFDVLPLADEYDKTPIYLVRYEVSATAPVNISPEAQGEQNSKLLQLQHELSAMREHLQTVIEELETSNEELQAVNEELQSANEELQSTNEELETSNEELQSTNEELTTVNEEIQVKSNEIQALNSDLQNLQQSLPHPLLVLDKELRLVHFNEAAKKIIDVSEQHLGELIELIPQKFPLPDIRLLLNRTSQHGETIQQQLKSEEHSYLLTVTNYRHTKGYGNGAILLFWENTELVDLYQSLQQMVINNNLQARAIEAAEQGILIVDAQKEDMPILYVNKAFSEMTGYAPEEVFGQNCRFLQGPDTDPLARLGIRAAIQQQRYKCLLKNYRKDGSSFWNRLSIAPVFESGKLTHYIGIQSDVTDTINSQSEALLAQTVFGNTSEKIAIFNQQQMLTYANKALQSILSPDRLLTTIHYTHLFNLMNEQRFDHGWQEIIQSDNWQGELLLSTGDLATPHYVSVSKVIDPSDQSLRLVLLATDIGELKAREQRLHKLAFYDDLTRLGNRLYLNQRLQETVSRHQRKGARFGLLFLDLDNFKRINDSLGHAFGDNILQHFADVLRKLSRESDFCARISGDEFVVLIDEIEQPQQAQHFAARIIEALKKPIKVSQERLFVSASIGIAIYPDDGKEADLLLRNADIAMYRAKQSGKNQFQFVDADRSDELRQQLKLEGDLRRAFYDDEDIGLVLHYQPYYSNTSPPKLIGAEALVRCHHPQLGDLTPKQILPAVKSANLVEAFDLWVMKQILQQRQIWAEQFQNFKHFQLSINLHAQHLQTLCHPSNLLGSLLSSMTDLSWLTIEVTEDALISQSSNVKKSLKMLVDLGVKVAIDDFGVGYSNFLYLTELNAISTVKLDRTLLKRIEQDEMKRHKIEALVKMLKQFGFETVAEGIETSAHFKAITGLKLDVLQGFFLNKPMMASMLAKTFETNTQN